MKQSESVRVFKSELRNLKYYKATLQSLEEAIEEKDISVLESYNYDLRNTNLEIEAVWVKLVGVGAIQYDKAPSAFNPKLAEQMKLELIEKYNDLLEKRKEYIENAVQNVRQEITRLTLNIEKCEKVLGEMPKEAVEAVKSVCVDGNSYKLVSNRVNLSETGLKKMTNRTIKKALH